MGPSWIDKLNRFIAGIGLASAKEALLTLLILALALGANHLHSKFLARQDPRETSPEKIRASRSSFRNGSWFAAFSALAFLWAGEIHSLIISLAALAAAVLVVGKEFVACLIGGALWTFSKPAKIGDSVEIAGVKGELLERGWTHLQLLVQGDSGPRTVGIPASHLITGNFVNHSAIGLSWARAEVFCSAASALECSELLLAKARELCEPWRALAEEQSKAFAATRLVTPPDCEPSCEIRCLDAEKTSVSVRLPAPSGQRRAFEQELVRFWLANRPAAPPPASAAPPTPNPTPTKISPQP